MSITTGMKGTATKIVTENDTAKVVKSGSLPVLATPVLSALMEEAACDAVKEGLAEGETTVGGFIGLAHKQPTLVGSTVRAEATVTVVKGKKITLHLIAYDEGGEIGEAEHIRFVVEAKPFMEKAKKPHLRRRADTAPMETPKKSLYLQKGFL